MTEDPFANERRYGCVFKIVSPICLDVQGKN